MSNYVLPSNLNYIDLQNLYYKYFSLSNLSKDVTDRFGVISLVCYLTNSQKLKSPDITCYKVIQKVLARGDNQLPDDFIKGLSVICEDYMLNCKEFNNFGLKNTKEIVDKLNAIFNNYLPF